MSEQSKVFLFDNSDPEMQRAHEQARANFRYFWREVHWEQRRIIPGLDLASVKAPFSDRPLDPKTQLPQGAGGDSDNPEVEHMWLSDVDFDGREVNGTLLNSPNWLKSVKEGDTVRVPLGQISDWMYSIGGEVYGAYTVNLIRSRMGRAERAEHDDAWGGLDFGDPAKIRVVPEPNSGGGLLKGWFGKKQTEIGEHPASENIAPEIQKQLAQDPSIVHSRRDDGWTFLHQEALAGSLAPVKVLLAAGADPKARTNHGMTPLALAQSLGWEKVVALLTPLT
jgi:uncharacterized protein YegJ (DUF2314 family)